MNGELSDALNSCTRFELLIILGGIASEPEHEGAVLAAIKLMHDYKAEKPELFGHGE